DLHSREFGPYEQSLYEMMRRDNDMVIFCGDFCYQMRIGNPIYGQDQEPGRTGLTWQGLEYYPMTTVALDVCQKLLDGFECPLGVYAVQGNHDPTEFMQDLKTLSVNVLRNETIQLSNHNGRQFNICGVCCWGRKAIDIPETLLNMDPKLFTLAICHYPEVAEPLAAAGIDLILFGHTHGGQICLPGGIPIISHSRTRFKYFAGLSRIKDTVIYTTRGLGATLIPTRTFCPAEITRITLHQGSANSTSIQTIKL
ncbi:MAG: metallophosphoesterase family protein, partial [Sedimentisphaerales bacterium]|nr:metallophosphoesterase family protein [Sedimentisphaerales bacterium]